jgi:hypothetical protein
MKDELLSLGKYGMFMTHNVVKMYLYILNCGLETGNFFFK